MFTILDLCGGTGSWSAPYREAGYEVVTVDVLDGADVRLLEWSDLQVQGILAAPPCTHLSSSGARWWAGKGAAALMDALSIADACLRAVQLYSPRWWALENPTGRLRRFYGPPHLTFNPSDYGDDYTKLTHIWGRFNAPRKTPALPTAGSKMHLLPPSPDRWRQRSATPAGFANAFFEANP